jgi:uncharacterized protein YraI
MGGGSCFNGDDWPTVVTTKGRATSDVSERAGVGTSWANERAAHAGDDRFSFDLDCTAGMNGAGGGRVAGRAGVYVTCGCNEIYCV